MEMERDGGETPQTCKSAVTGPGLRVRMGGGWGCGGDRYRRRGVFLWYIE